MVIPNWWEVKESQYQDSRVNLFDGLNFKLVILTHGRIFGYEILCANQVLSVHLFPLIKNENK